MEGGADDDDACAEVGDELSLVVVAFLCEPPRLDGVVKPFTVLSPSPLPPLCIPEKYCTCGVDDMGKKADLVL